MADIFETVKRYSEACKELDVKTSEYIKIILGKEKDKVNQLKKKGEKKHRYEIHLGGNNRLLTDVRLKDADVNALYKTLQANTYIVSMDLRYNNITDAGCEFLAKLLEENTTLKVLNLMCNDFGENGAQCLAKALHTNDTLESLRVNGNKIDNQGGMYFAQALQVNTKLQDLDLGDTDQRIESVIALATVLKYNRTLKSLNVSRPQLYSRQEEHTVHVAEMLKVNRGLEELHMMKYDMRDFGVSRLAENLRENYKLVYLNLSCNRMTRDGAKELAKLIRYDTCLKVLDLGYNRLGDDGAKSIAEALTNFNRNLKTLVLKCNEIAGEGLCAVADCMRQNTTLEGVYIWGNHLDHSACLAFSGLIETGRLETKYTDVSPYVVDGITYLSELSHGIRQWYYWGPTYGDQARPELAELVYNS